MQNKQWRRKSTTFRRPRKNSELHSRSNTNWKRWSRLNSRLSKVRKLLIMSSRPPSSPDSNQIRFRRASRPSWKRSKAVGSTKIKASRWLTRNPEKRSSLMRRKSLSRNKCMTVIRLKAISSWINRVQTNLRDSSRKLRLPMPGCTSWTRNLDMRSSRISSHLLDLLHKFNTQVLHQKTDS